MRCSNCGVCCTETEMFLAEKDIENLMDKGFRKSFFVKINKEGYAQLRNLKGYCVFYDDKNHRCSVYADRPAGCRVYPVIVDDEKGIVLDDICQSRGTITDREKRMKGKRVTKLLERIDHEAENRRFGKTIFQ
jgi:Fe-S-cluster containining protein